MVERSHPWDKDVAVGDIGPYGIPEYARYLEGNQQYYKDDLNAGSFTPTYGGVKPGYRGDLQVIPTTPASANVTILPGGASVYGWDYENTTNITQAITANALGATRIDTIGLALTNASQTVRYFYRTGTATNPPALTQVPGTLIEIPIAYVMAPNAFATITQDDIFSAPNLAQQSRTIAMSVNIESGAAAPGLPPGLLAYWQGTNQREIESGSVSIANKNVYAGVLEGGYTVSGRGNAFRIVTQGFTPVRFKAGETPAVSDGFVPDFAADMRYAVASSADSQNSIGIVVSTDGYPTEMPLCYVNMPPKVANYHPPELLVYETASGNVASTVIYSTRALSNVSYNHIYGASLAANAITLPEGLYRVTGSSPGIGCGRHQAYVYSTVAGVPLALGTAERSINTDAMTRSLIDGEFAVPAGGLSDIVLQHIAENAVAAGYGDGTGIYDRLAVLKITKIL